MLSSLVQESREMRSKKAGEAEEQRSRGAEKIIIYS
jgi:hypothetical protein